MAKYEVAIPIEIPDEWEPTGEPTGEVGKNGVEAVWLPFNEELMQRRGYKGIPLRHAAPPPIELEGVHPDQAPWSKTGEKVLIWGADQDGLIVGPNCARWAGNCFMLWWDNKEFTVDEDTKVARFKVKG